MSAPFAASHPYSWQEEDEKTKGDYQAIFIFFFNWGKKRFFQMPHSGNLQLNGLNHVT